MSIANEMGIASHQKNECHFGMGMLPDFNLRAKFIGKVGLNTFYIFNF